MWPKSNGSEGKCKETVIICQVSFLSQFQEFLNGKGWTLCIIANSLKPNLSPLVFQLCKLHYIHRQTVFTLSITDLNI